jgi:molybdopterin/thiamine biosynthesis adenylyltransferase
MAHATAACSLRRSGCVPRLLASLERHAHATCLTRAAYGTVLQPENCQRCVDSGVLGPVPGVMGTMQALEAMKVLAGVGRPLTGKLLLYDALFGSFHTIKLCTKDPACAVCGEHPTVRSLTATSLLTAEPRADR